MAVQKASYFDISEKLFPNKGGYLSKEENDSILQKTEEYIKLCSNIHFGDILFIGTHSDRIEYGFYIILEDKKIKSLRDSFLFGIIELYQDLSLLEKIKEYHIKYDDAIINIVNDWSHIIFSDGFEELNTLYIDLIFLFYENDLIDSIDFNLKTKEVIKYVSEKGYSNILKEIFNTKTFVFDPNDVVNNPIFLCLQNLLCFIPYANDDKNKRYKNSFHKYIEILLLLIKYGVNYRYFYDEQKNTFYINHNNKKIWIELPEIVQEKLKKQISEI